jgi:hypothetical protein
MKILERSAITIAYKKPFIEWNNAVCPEILMYENILIPSKTYLIEGISDNAKTTIEQHFKEIFEIELRGICSDESEWPSNRNIELFYEWFSCEISDFVIDLSNTKLIESLPSLTEF